MGKDSIFSASFLFCGPKIHIQKTALPFFFCMDTRTIEDFRRYLETSQTFLLLGPKNIDGDTIGTNVAFAMYLEQQLGKRAVLYSPVPIDDKYRFLPWTDRFVSTFDPEEVEAIFTSDTAVPHLFAHTEAEERVFARGIPWVNLDHHISNSRYGTLPILDFASTSCSMILYRLILALGGQITADMATHMIMSIYSDSGSFIHPNTTEDTYRVAGALMEAGAAQAEVAQRLFLTNHPGKLRLWGRVLERMHLGSDGVLFSAVNMQDMQECGTEKEDLEGLVDLMNTIPNRVCVLLSEDGKGNVKGSLRTGTEDVDVNVIAQRFGGGGHRLAAGFTMKGKMLVPQMTWKVVEREPSALGV